MLLEGRVTKCFEHCHCFVQPQSQSSTVDFTTCHYTSSTSPSGQSCPPHPVSHLVNRLSSYNCWYILLAQFRRNGTRSTVNLVDDTLQVIKALFFEVDYTVACSSQLDRTSRPLNCDKDQLIDNYYIPV